MEGVVLTRVSSLSGYDSASTDGRLDRCMPLVKPIQKMRKHKMSNSIGIDIGKKKCSAAIRNNESGEILEEVVFTRDRQGMMSLIQRVEQS